MRAQEEVGGEIVHGFERAFRHDHPTQSPAGHAEELGEAGAYDGVRVAGEHGFHVGAVRFAVGQVKVGFVDDTPCAAFFRQVAHGFQGVEGDGGTGRVRRRGDHHRFGAIRPVFVAQFRCEMESGGRIRRHVHDFAAERANQFAIARVRRVGDQHLVTLVHRQCGGKQQCRGTSGRNRDTFRIDVHMVAFLVEIGNRLTQFRQTHCGGIWQWTAIILFAHRITHCERSAEIRLPQAQLDHIGACGDHLVGHRTKHHGTERISNLGAVRHLRQRAVLSISHSSFVFFRHDKSR